MERTSIAACEPAGGPLVGVIIPCFNQGLFVAEAVQSVRAQTYPALECLVVDDGSSDPVTLRALEQLQAEGVRILRQANQGLASARNTGIRGTAAPYIVPLDADDRLHPRFVERLLPPLLSDAGLGYCYSHARMFGAEERIWACAPYEPLRLLASNLSTATAVIRRRALERAGGYRLDMRHGYEDWDLWLGLLSAGYAGRCIPEALLEYRRHAGGSMLTRMGDHREEMILRLIEHHHALFARLLGVRDDPSEIAAARAALVRVLTIEDARFWRLLGWSARLPPLREGCDPRRRLARIERSLAYRCIRRLKATVLYGRFAQRRHGLRPDELRRANPFA